ncbi:MAG: hypothetical protein F2923_07455 [Actinobacteria bacterium]|uniref:Unannotated protein n=1 Tax=freshwater metagenome TaxID=449393 RepID=A0A6J7SP01_9ZZZZ|nr:hypothetical protein [Actinomycetota bacterium]MTB28460.1 hypothetical protein [Actinomycetota bacterium]
MTSDLVEKSDTSIDELIAEITAARTELLASVETLKSQFTSASLRQRGISAVTGVFVDEFGGIKPKRIGIVAGVVVGVVALKLLGRRLR